MNQPHETKTKILNVARELFADQGFAGTSVRDIAKVADVNVAAVNYHFENKQNLFWNVFKQSVESLESEILALDTDKKLDPPELAGQIYLLMKRRKVEMRATFRLILSSNFPENEQGESVDFCRGRLGPPGSEALEESLKREVGSDVDPHALFWGAKVIFSHLVHVALMLSTDYVKQFSTPETAHMIQDKYVVDAIKHHARAVVSYLKENQSEVSKDLKV